MSNIIFYIGAFDTVVIAALGMTAAGLVLFGYDSKKFWDRVWPASLITIGTTIAAGIAMLITQWISGV